MNKLIVDLATNETRVVPLTDDEIALKETQAVEFQKQVIRERIATLEASITPRRIREHLLGTGGTFIQDVEARIADLRTQLV